MYVRSKTNRLFFFVFIKNLNMEMGHCCFYGFDREKPHTDTLNKSCYNCLFEKGCKGALLFSEFYFKYVPPFQTFSLLCDLRALI